MKKIIYVLLVLILGLGLVFAQETTKGQQEKPIPETYENENQVRNEQLVIMPVGEKSLTQIKNTQELKQSIQEKNQEMNQELENLSEQEQNKYQNQNQVRLAVHALLGMENITGGIGKNVSAIAKEFNNSIQATIRAEEKIQQRNAFTKFFIGADKKAADELEKEVNQNKERIKELKRLRNECEQECSEEIKTIMQEQIQNMEQEQNRLENLAQETKQKKGIVGWIWK